eukprot:11709627-Prorocentrum_lima.AAC.1
MRGPGRASKYSTTSLRWVAEKPLITRMLRLLVAPIASLRCVSEKPLVTRRLRVLWDPVERL